MVHVHERGVGNVERVTRAGFVWDFNRGKSYSLRNKEEIEASVSGHPKNSFELSSAGQSFLLDIDSDNTGEISAKTSPLNSQMNLNGQTPRLYDDVFAFMFRIANVLGIPVNYSLVTEDEDVITWAKSSYGVIGASGWDETIPKGDGFEFTKRIIPISTNGHHG